MSEKVQTSSTIPRVLRRYVIVAAAYTLLLILLPASNRSMQTYNLSSTEFRILLFAIAVPSFVAWLAAFIGYARLYDYANSLEGSSESESYKKLALGITWLAWALPIPTIITLILNSIAYKYPGFHSTATIVSNYTALILPLTAFIIIGSAARTLTQLGELSFDVKKARSMICLFVVAGLAYCYFTFSRFDLLSLSSTSNPYYLPIWLMILTIIVPYLFAWFTGLLAAFEIKTFSKNVRGVLYRQALQLLVAGIVTVVVSSIALQYINSASPRTGYLLLSYKLLIISFFKVLAGAGFVLIALGAAKLQKIEEV
jgi:hypothetical protein